MSDILKDIKNWFKIAVPEPTEDNRRVQLGCHLEEVVKMCDVVEVADETTRYATSSKEHIIDKNTYTGSLIESLEIIGVDELPERIKNGYYERMRSPYMRMVYTVDINNQKAFAYALADQVVTLVGLAHMHGIDIEGILKEVNRSNWSKFENGKPVYDENGEIKKGKDYTPPDLSQFVRE